LVSEMFTAILMMVGIKFSIGVLHGKLNNIADRKQVIAGITLLLK